MGRQGREDSHCRGGTETGGVWDKRGRQSDHWQTLQPRIPTDKLEGRTWSGGVRGRQSGRWHPAAPHSRTDKPGGTAGSEADHAIQGSSAGK